MKTVLYFTLLFFVFSGGVFSQGIDFSIPQKMNSSNTQYNILGKISDGILVLERSRGSDFLETYYDDMTLHWRRPLLLKDKNADIQKVLIADDSVTVVYLQFVKNITLLRVSKLSDVMVETNHSIIVDTLATNSTSTLPIIRFTSSADHKHFLIFTTPDNFYENRNVQFYLFDSDLKLVMKNKETVARDLIEPTLMDVLLTPANNVVCLLAERTLHNQRDDYNLDRLEVSFVKRGALAAEISISEPKEFYSHPVIRLDAQNHRLLLTGFYAIAPGESGDGTFYYNISMDSMVLSGKSFEKFSDDFISLVTGNIPPKGNDAFENFQVMDAIVKNDGGMILVAESQYEANENVANPMYGPFGIASSVTITYYHYDDIALFAFDASGKIEWKRILHKRQESEGDGGFYSSYSMMIGSQLCFLYNDNSGGQNNVSEYSVKPDGEILRSDLFSNDQKGVMLIPKEGKQVSVHELVIPSIRRNFVQFVKFTL